MMVETAAAEVLARKAEEREVKKSLEHQDQILSIRRKKYKKRKKCGGRRN